MLTVIINWLYMLLIVFCLGYAFSRFSEKTLHYELERVDSILMAGFHSLCSDFQPVLSGEY